MPEAPAEEPAAGAASEDEPRPAPAEGGDEGPVEEAAAHGASDAPSAAPGGPAIELRGLTVGVPGKTLIEGADLTIARGERVLLVGPSGAGKSVLLRLLTGLLPIDDEEAGYTALGTARVAGASVLERRERERARDAVGIVFQDHALLDELSAAGNLAFARDHASSPGAGEACQRALAFLRQHGIDPAARVGTLSGGQKQRVAIARALARDPEVVFYDEPTSALDPRTARAVAALIADAAAGFHKTQVIVTHDYAPFRGDVDRVLFLDPAARALREIDWAELDRIMSAPAPAAATSPAEAELEPAGPGLLARLGAGAADLAAGTPTAAVGALAALPYAVWPWRARASWFLRWLGHYARITFAGSALPYTVIAGVIAGFVATYFTYKFLPRPELTEALILDEILPNLGFALYRIVVPVLVTILIAGRTGAALASDFGTRVYQHQTLAMRSLGASPIAYLGTSALWASLVGMLVVAAVAFWAACFTSLAVFVTIKPDMTPFYWSGQFFRKLQPFWGLAVGKGWGWVVTKLLVSAGGIAAIAYLVGSRPKRSTADVSRGITLTVYWGTVFVLLVHFVCAFFEFQKPPVG